MASSAALPRPTMPATFSVPARCRRSWLPPTISGSIGVPRRTYIAPTPFGPCILCALIEHKMAAESAHIEWNLARALHRVDMEEDAGFRGDFSDFFNRLQHAGFVIRQHHADQPRVGPDGAAESLRDR